MGSYSTYHGRLELLINKGKEILEGWRPEKSPTEFGEQLVCVAMYWLTQNVIETSKNYGNFIDLFKKQYYGTIDEDIKQSAYCAVFAWFLMDEATKTVGCQNRFPDKNYWGAARATFEASKNIYTTDMNPEIGSLMFRYSTDSSASGHYGLVIDVDRKNRTFTTVEGNVAITNDGSKEGVGSWLYRWDDIKESNGMSFIHVEQDALCKNLQSKNYKGFECRPVVKKDNPIVQNEVLPPCITKNGNAYTYTAPDGKKYNAGKGTNNQWFTYDLLAGKWIEINNCNADFKVNIAQKTETAPPPKENYSPAEDKQTPAPDKVEKCKYIITKIPQKSELQHYSVLMDKKVLADVVSANIGNESDRNGSALWYNNSLNTGKPTGFGMFKDKIGNLIYVLDGDAQESQTIMKNGFLGYKLDNSQNAPSDANVIVIYRNAAYYNGGGWKERFVEDTINRKYQFVAGKTIGDFTSGSVAIIPPQSNLNHVVDWSKVPDSNVINYLKEIENKGKKLNTPIVIYITERGDAPSLTRELSKFLQVVGTLSNLIGIPVPPQIMKGSETLIAVAEGKAGITDFATSLFQMTEFFAPEFVKDVNNTIGNLRSGIGSYIKQAENTFKDIVQTGTYSSLFPDTLKSLEKTLGLDGTEIQKLLGRYESFNSQGTTADLSKILRGFNLSDVSKIVENASNAFMLDTVKRGLQSGGLQMNAIGNSNPIRNVPIIQDLFIAGGSNSALRLFPRIEDFTSGLLKNQSVKNIVSTAQNPNEMIAGLVGNVFGNIPLDKSIMKEFQIEALLGKALQTDKNQPFALPASIEPEYQECYKFIVEQSTDRKVLWCPDGWEWDYDLRKCVNKTAKSGYTGNANTNQNQGTGITAGSVDTGSLFKKVPEKTIPIDTSIPNKITTPILTGNSGYAPLPIPLPPCVVAEGGEYYFYPNKSKNSLKTVYENEPKQNISPIPGATQNQLVKNDLKAGEYISLPGGVVTLPPQFINTTGTINSSSLIPTQNYSLPLPLQGLSDEILPDKIRVYRTNTGTDKEAWYVRINNVLYDFDPYNCQIIGYNPNKKEDVVIPDKKIVPPDDSSEAEKLIKKLEEQRKELEAQLELAKSSKVIDTQPDERIIALEKQLQETKLANQQRENLLVEQLKQIGSAKAETSPEVKAQLEQSQKQIEALTNLVNQQNKQVATNPNQDLVNQIGLLKQQLELEKNKQQYIEKTAPQVQKAVAECTNCDLAKMPSRVVNITEYGKFNNQSDDCGCEEECY